MTTLENLQIYQMSMSIADEIWNEVIKWNYFEKRSIGLQLTRAADSISANIAEGYGRRYPKETMQFFYYSRGSLKESICFLQKSFNRKLIEKEKYDSFLIELNLLGKKLNSFINSLQKASAKP
jgi:four helix bundle protein